MRTQVVNHPLIAHKLTLLRRADTTPAAVRLLVEELVLLLAFDATASLRVRPVAIQTPVAPYSGQELDNPQPMIVPILRAGLGMLNGMLRLIPSAEVGFLGLKRDEESLEASIYADRLPTDVAGRQVFVLDPMLATGGTLVTAINILLDRGASSVTAICLLAAPEGLGHVEESFRDRADDISLVIAALDERLNDSGYIVPGLGDAGDRLFGVA